MKNLLFKPQTSLLSFFLGLSLFSIVPVQAGVDEMAINHRGGVCKTGEVGVGVITECNSPIPNDGHCYRTQGAIMANDWVSITDDNIYQHEICGRNYNHGARVECDANNVPTSVYLKESADLNRKFGNCYVNPGCPKCGEADWIKEVRWCCESLW